MNWNKFWDTLAWIGFGITIMYLIFKAFGIIHSPISIDIVTIIGASIFIGRHIQKVEHISKEVNIVKKDVKFLTKMVDNVEDEIAIMRGKVVIVKNKLNI